MNYEKHTVSGGTNESIVHHFKTKSDGEVVVLFHGYFEDGRIFYSNNGKGLAPFLAQAGFDVFVVDFPGKSASEQKIAEGVDYSQNEIITSIIPSALAFVRKFTGVDKIHVGAHSWGGVVFMAYMARFKDENLRSFFSFGAKRRIGRLNLRRLVYIEIGWYIIGNYLSNKYGFLPHKLMKLGNEDEPKSYFKQTSKWIYTKTWVDPADAFDYANGFDNYEAPRSLFITGKKDKILGHPKDVQALQTEMKSAQSTYLTIGQKTGFKNDYDHISILTHKDAPNDHFRLVVAFLNETTK